MKRKTSKPHRRTRQSVLEVRVMSPRIAWLGFVRVFGKLVKIACLLAVLTTIGWGIWRGIQHTFHKNPDFQLQVIDLNANPVIDEIGLVELAGINLSTNPSLFDVDVDQTRKRLAQLPAIVDARVERHLPGTLVVRVTSRSPKAWISPTGSNLNALRQTGGLLIDAMGYVYPCPEKQTALSKKLPIILISPSHEYPLTAGQELTHPEVEHCFNLLEAVKQADPQSTHWIQSIRQANEWSLRLVTRQGTSATFGLTNHEQQINRLRAALNHAGQKSYRIDTINLIPKFNVPITVRGENTPPRAIPVSEAKVSSESLSSLLQRH